MKRIISLVLALMLMASLSVTAFANSNTSLPSNGSISLNGIAVKEVNGTIESVAQYSVYKMFDLVTYDAEKDNYSYQVADGWEGFIATGGAGASYFKENEHGYVEWISTSIGEDRSIRAAQVAKLALTYAEENHIVPNTSGELVPTSDAEGNVTYSVVFSGLELGYYLVDSDMGVLCGLTTTNPSVNMAAKNAPPTVNKQVKEDSWVSSGAEYGASNDDDLGTPLYFDTTVTVHAGAQKYHLHDKMARGLTFDEITNITHYSGNTTKVLTANNDYTLNETCDLENCDCTFNIKFKETFADTLKTGDRIVVHYTAHLNEYAIDGGTGNTNETWLTFGGSEHESNHSTTTTYTYAFDLVKVTSGRDLLDGATFKLYRSETGNDEIPLVAVKDEENNIAYYRLAITQEEKNAWGANSVIEVKGGKVRIVGLDSDTYYLEEKTAPKGYNLLSGRKEFTIDEKNLDAKFNSENGKVEIGKVEIGTGVQVENKSGTILPQTGAMGTMMFITFGTLVVMAAGVLLVTKKRMSMIED